MAWAAAGCLATAAGSLGCAPARGSATGKDANPGASGSSDSYSPSPDGLLSASAFAFDTFITLQALCDRKTLDSLMDRCFYFESIFSRTKPQSDVARLNANKGEPIDVNSETADIIKRSLEYSDLTNGLFDITIGAVSELWDFKEGIKPADEAIEEAVSHVSYRNVRVDGNTIQLLDPQARIDLGGIAKGYIADDLAQILAQAGCQSACLDLGGTIRTIGTQPDGKPWRIGIQDPLGESGDLVQSVETTDGSVVTSGLRERCFTQEGKRYWHILDPRTGFPADSRIESASIIGASGTEGEALAKPLFMMEIQDALNWIEAQPAVEAVLVDSTGNTLRTSGANAVPAFSAGTVGSA